ncbi:hypothetical protein BE21_29710 [Sorangium cellulosum]|uniref:Uncharacterized protein n=1 Tax=Sorangium cellulosum TaxID=56 RepID=A0A150TRN1_SORCE|nr:hypothetical protein BE21_29710 [Sorangium cellulosum]
MIQVISWATIAAAAVAQAFITARLWRSDLYLSEQKIAQSALIWLLPIVGAIVVYAGLRQQDDVSRPTPNPECEVDD